MKLYEGPIEVYQLDKNLMRVGPVPTYSGTVINRSKGVGSYQVRIAMTSPTWRTTNPTNEVEGHHLIINQGPDSPLIAGPIINDHLSYDQGVWTLVVNGECHLTYLHRMITLPTPNRAINRQDLEGWYKLAKRSAEVNIKQLVREHVSRTAPRTENRTPLVVSASQGRGGNTTLSSRFKNVYDEAQTLATSGGLILTSRIEQVGTHQFQPIFDVREARDLSKHVRLTTGNHGIIQADIQRKAAEANRVLVAGQGQAENRTLISVEKPLGDWNLRSTIFQDRRDTDDHDELRQAGKETLEDNKEMVSITATIRELAHAKHGRDFLTGDTITLGVGDQHISDEVTEATTAWDASGTTTRLVTGKTASQDSLATVDQVRKIVRALEPGRTI